MDTTPGSHFEYNDGVSVLIGKIIRQVTGMRADEWAREQLVAPIRSVRPIPSFTDLDDYAASSLRSIENTTD